jgi:hypothetical protein
MNIYNIGQEDKPRWFGWGQTKGPLRIENDGVPRKGGDYNKARDAGVIYTELGFYEDVDVTDHMIKPFVKKIPGIRQVGTEAYECIEGYPITPEIVQHMVEEEFFSKTPKKKETLELHEHQKEFVIKSTWQVWKEFLLFAKCRAGKTAMVLTVIVTKGYKTTLIVSRQKSPMQSWKEDSDKFSNFSNLVFIDINDKDYLQQIDYWYKTDKQIILWACVQSRRILDLPVDVDLLVYDEAHIGYDSAQWRKLREVTDCPVIYATGTAYKMVWDFADSNRYIYDYFREQLDKKNGLNNSSSMRVVLPIYDSAQYRAIFGDDPDAMKNMFNVDGNGDFIHPELVQDFVTNKFVTRLLRTQNRLLKDSTHLYITLPSVAACYAFAEYMKGTRFAPLVVTGDSGKNSDDINKHIKENRYGSCILTRTANVLGVTAKEVDTIINCAEGSSIEFWTQFAFRGGSSDRDWLVIDFCPQRCLKSLRQSFVAACDTNPELAQYTFTDFIVIDEWNEGFTTLNQDQVVALLAADVGDTINLVSGIADRLNFKNLENIDFQIDLEASYSNVAKSVLLNDNGANGKTNKKKENQSEKSEKSVLYSRQETIKAILERVPLVIYHCLKCGEQVNSIYNVIESEHYIHDTMDCEEIIRQSIDEDVINPKTLSYTISQASDDIQHFMNEDECETLSKLSCSGKTQQQLSIESLDELFR